jgi:hypothetical protein
MATLDATLADLIDRIGAESAVVVIDDPGLDADGDRLGRRVIASAGLPEVALAGLTAAMRDPEHPVSAAFGHPATSFDVRPTRAGGPALRSHVPVTTAGSDDRVLAVLAIAHDRSLGDGARADVIATAASLASALARQAGGPF